VKGACQVRAVNGGTSRTGSVSSPPRTAGPRCPRGAAATCGPLSARRSAPETLLAHTTPAEVAAGGRPTLGGFEVGKVPFHVTGETQDLTAQYFGGSGLPADSMFGTLTPKVDYVR